MVEFSGSLEAVYTAEVSAVNDGYVIEVPNRELELGNIAPDETVQVALLGSPRPDSKNTGKTEADRVKKQQAGSDSERVSAEPPVREGETLQVTIEGVGDQGDGVAKVDRGYVLIVPGTEPGEQPTVQVDTVKENVGFAEVIK